MTEIRETAMDCDDAVDEAFQMRIKGGSQARYRIGPD